MSFLERYAFFGKSHAFFGNSDMRFLEKNMRFLEKISFLEYLNNGRWEAKDVISELFMICHACQHVPAFFHYEKNLLSPKNASK